MKNKKSHHTIINTDEQESVESSVIDNNLSRQNEIHFSNLMREKDNWDDDMEKNVEISQRMAIYKEYDYQQASNETNRYKEQHTNRLNEILKQKLTQDLFDMQLIDQDPFNEEDIILDDSYVHFNVGRFFKFFIYHILEFNFTGPLLTMFTYLYEGRNFCYNLGFWGISKISIDQTLHFTFFAFSISASVLLPEEYINPEAMFIAMLVSMLKIITIAFRYATASDTRIKEQYLRRFTKEDNATEFLKEAWQDFTPKTIDREVKHSMVRNEIENKTFFLSILQKQDKDTYDKFTDFNYYEKNKHDPKKTKALYKSFIKIIELLEKSSRNLKGNVSIKPQELHATYKTQKENSKHVKITPEMFEDYLKPMTTEEFMKRYPGRLILREILLTSKSFTLQRPKIAFPLIAVIHGLLPFLVDLTYELTGNSSVEKWTDKYKNFYFWLYLIATFYINCYVYYQNTLFLDIAFTDLQRRHYAMKSLSSMVQPNRLKMRGSYKLFSLINIFDSMSLLSWLDMRIITMDIGLRFYIRIQLYSSLYIILYVILGAVYLCFFFGISITFMTQQQWYPLIFEIFNFLGLLIVIFIAGARINMEGENQIMRMVELRNIQERVLSEWSIIMDERNSNNGFLNNTFQLAYYYYKSQLEVMTVEECKQSLRENIRILETVQERLEKETSFNQIKFLGIPITKQIIYAIFTGLGSLLLAIIQKKTTILS